MRLKARAEAIAHSLTGTVEGYDPLATFAPPPEATCTRGVVIQAAIEAF